MHQTLPVHCAIFQRHQQLGAKQNAGVNKAGVKEADSVAWMAPASMSANLATTGGLLLLVQVTESPGAISFDAAVMPGHVRATVPPRTDSAMSALATVAAVLPLFVSIAV
jgi:hypothetical protein